MISRRPWITMTLVMTLLASGVALHRDMRPTAADSQPADPTNPATPPTVTADALPTVQINGVAWTQVVARGLVFVGGRFDSARPAGARIGQAETTRSNFLAYRLTDGTLVETIAPSFNAQVRTLAVSPSGDRLYVGGDFTTVDGVSRSRLAAFALPSMELVSSFAPPVGYHVHALAVSPDGGTLYVGGNFDAVGGQARNKLAAFGTDSGGLLDWAPQALGGLVSAMVLSPIGDRLLVGGKFTSLNGSTEPGYGLGAVGAVTGELLPWAANSLIRNGTDRAAITSLVSDGEYVYGTGFTRTSSGVGTLEGAFAASWDGGVLHWVADCHGDHYAIHAAGDVVYAVGHAHFCGNFGGFPQTGGDVQSRWTYQRAIAVSRARTGTVAPNRTGRGFFDFGGSPAPTFLHWYPDIDFGRVTGQLQGPWHITGGNGYIVLGGEFEVVNGVAQQGLVRFAPPAAAPNLEGPRVSGAGWNPSATVAPGETTISVAANWDRDNARLAYRLERDGRVVAEATASSTQFDRPTITLVDRSAPGGPTTYRVVAVDPFGNQATSASLTVTVPTPPSTTAPVTTTTAPGVTTTLPGTTTTSPVTTTTSPVTTTTAPVTTTTAPVTTTTAPSAPPGPDVIAADRFDHPVEAGWGTSLIGGPWSTDSALTMLGARDGSGRIVLDTPSLGAGAFVGTAERDVDVTATVSVVGTPTGGGTYLSLVGRRIGRVDARVKVRYTAAGGLELYLTRTTGGATAASTEVDLASLVVFAQGWDPARPLRVRFQVTGASPTELRAKVWPADTSEPFGWQLVAVDGSPEIQGAGGIGLMAYLSASATSPISAVFDDFEARAVRADQS